MLDAEELKILDEITKWMAVNSEAIYATRPWKIFGEGPVTVANASKDSSFNEDKRKDLTADDVRFTKKGGTLYAFVMGWPQSQAIITPLALGGKLSVGKIGKVELLGHGRPVQWTQDDTALKITLPPEKPCNHAVVFRVAGIA
jgi:alpha-L-fucosidase